MITLILEDNTVMIASDPDLEDAGEFSCDDVLVRIDYDKEANNSKIITIQELINFYRRLTDAWRHVMSATLKELDIVFISYTRTKVNGTVYEDQTIHMFGNDATRSEVKTFLGMQHPSDKSIVITSIER